jgi:hypothetical protein
VLEVGLNPSGDLGDAFHDPHRLLHQVAVVVAGRLQAQGRLEVVVQVLVGVGFRGIGRQVEQFDLVLEGFRPVPDNFGVMNPQVVDDQEDLGRCILKQMRQKLDEALGIDGAFDDLES